MIIEMLHTIAPAFPVVFSTLGGALGQAFVGRQAAESLYQQPEAYKAIQKTKIIGLAITETGAILGLVISILFLLNPVPEASLYYASLGRIGIGLSIGVSGFIGGLMSSRPVVAACIATTRQPFFNGKILNLMFITQTLIMTPNIFGFLIALLIKAKLATAVSMAQGLQLLAAGICMGFGSIGPTIGLSTFAYAACMAIGKNKKIYGRIVSLTFVTEAMIETAAIFALLISLTILNWQVTPETPVAFGIAFIAAACCMALCTMAPGVSSGRTGAAACSKIAEIPEAAQNISRLNLLALAFIDSFPIYGLIVSITLLYFT